MYILRWPQPPFLPLMTTFLVAVGFEEPVTPLPGEVPLVPLVPLFPVAPFVPLVPLVPFVPPPVVVVSGGAQTSPCLATLASPRISVPWGLPAASKSSIRTACTVTE